jgi:nucleoside-diphosphate-sugar epimerase
MKTLLIIGGSGFFGKSILDCFHRGMLNYWSINKIKIMARDPHRLVKEAPSLINSDIELIPADISNINYLPNADYVIHAAASSNAQNYINSPIQERVNIIAAVSNYCKLAKSFHQKAKILYVSSGAVYGKQPPDIENIDENYSYSDSINVEKNKQDYTYAKRDSEKEIIALGLSGLNVSIARCFAFLGPWLPLDQHFAIGNFINDGLNCRSINVQTKHKVYRSYMYADDLVEWLMTIAEKSRTSSPVYNVGSDQSILIDELAQKISTIFGQNAPMYSHESDYIDRYVPNIDKAKSELNLKNKYHLDDAIRLTIKLLKQRNIYV